MVERLSRLVGEIDGRRAVSYATLSGFLNGGRTIMSGSRWAKEPLDDGASRKPLKPRHPCADHDEGYRAAIQRVPESPPLTYRNVTTTSIRESAVPIAGRPKSLKSSPAWPGPAAGKPSAATAGASIGGGRISMTRALNGSIADESPVPQRGAISRRAAPEDGAHPADGAGAHGDTRAGARGERGYR
jgi:hypothetical protein